ncbi:MAG: hypothetical protein KJN76_01560, partial [Eudoraea sp.]|nr:hypothetical protein [Eudoraea sp.]
MSNSINASYTDPILNSIRARTKTKDDGIPFLLLPVRLETRFMEVEQPLLTEDAGLFEKLLGQFGQINMALLDDVTRLNSNALRIKYNGIVEQLKLLNRDLNGVDKLAAQEITWLKQQESITQEKGQGAIRLLVTPAARLVGAALRRQLSVLRSRLNGLGKAKDPTYFPAKEFIDKLKYFERKWDAMEKAKVPYSNAKNKRRLYIYLTKSLDEITQYYGLGLKAIEDIKTIRKNQVDQIEVLMSGLLANILSAPGRLNSIYPDDNWKAFINDFKNKIDDQLLPSGQGFAKKIMTRLRFLEKFKTVTAQDIYYKAIQTLVDLKKFNESKPRGYRDIKKSRKKLDKRVRTLANMTNLVITGTPGQIKNIQSLWQQMESVIEQYQQKVTTIQNLNDSQAFGVNTTINFTREKARNAIAGLKKQAPEKFTFHNNQQIMESGEFYLKAKEEIKLLQGAAEALQQGNPTPSKKAKLNNMLKVVSAKFKVASRKNIVLPQSEFQELQRAIQSAKEAIANVSDDATPANTATIRAVEEVGNNFLSIRGGGTNPLDNLELPPVLAVPTKTVNELWLRIFPDDIHVHTHEEKLTENELRLGKLFWTSYWAASEDKELEMAAWRNLRLALGVRRAAWVARKLQPREHSYRNKRPFFRNTPSRGIIDVVSQLKGIQELLKP